MEKTADFHLHSRYSRAVSSQMTLPVMAEWALVKGIDILGTGDFTHPLWFKELKENLTGENGIYKIKEKNIPVSFLLSAEISSIYSQGGRTRRVHNILLVSSFEKAAMFNAALLKRKVNLFSDGRPITGLSSYELLKIFKEIDEKGLFIPAHIWTPWFSLFGANSGFDSLVECFGDMSEHIVAVETGLSSDPLMNWFFKDLKGKGIVSFSDAHSPANLGRELTVVEVDKLDFSSIAQALSGGAGISNTIEFYPEEGKYHYTGHRNCKVIQKPEETKRLGTICPVCGKPLTIGVMHRVEQLSGEIKKPKYEEDDVGLRWVKDEGRPPFISLVPLAEIIAEANGLGKSSKKVLSIYQNLVRKFGNELLILTKTRAEDISTFAGEKLAEGITKVRKGDIYIRPGFDGEYGKVKVWPEKEEKKTAFQEGLF